MVNGMYVVQTKGISTMERQMVKVHHGIVKFFNDPDSDWSVSEMLDSFEVICRLDLNSFKKEIQPSVPVARKLKFEEKVLIGDKIRAYDFEPSPGRVPCYVEGIVQRTSSEYGYNSFVIRCEKDSLSTEAPYTRVGHEVFVPMETSMDYDARIEVIG